MQFKRNKNTDYIYNTLTSDKIAQMTGGKIPKMTPEQAAGMIGSWVVETGDPTLQNLDVVEKVAGAGRGLSQYTGSRRIPYDRARHEALQAGQDPNSAEWQLQYFADEYTGKYDQNGRSLSGWTRNIETAPQGLTPAQYAVHYTGSAAEGKGYFRPGVPHHERRSEMADAIYNAYKALGGDNSQLRVPEIKQGALQIPQEQPAQQAQPQRAFGQEAILNGKPVRWGGDSYGWQSPESFQQVEQPQQPNPLQIIGDGVRNLLGIR